MSLKTTFYQMFKKYEEMKNVNSIFVISCFICLSLLRRTFIDLAIISRWNLLTNSLVIYSYNKLSSRFYFKRHFFFAIKSFKKYFLEFNES